MSIFGVLLVLISPAVGSYLGVLVDRLPRGEDSVSKRSACRACGHPLGLGDLVPVISFVMRGGKCRYCTAPIPPWHLYIELLAAGLTLIVVLLSPTLSILLVTVPYIWLLVGLFFADLIWFRLPNPFTLLLLAVGLLHAGVEPSLTLLDGLLGATVGGLCFWALRALYTAIRGREGLGLGDVKLIAGIGAGLGLSALPYVVLSAALTGICAEVARSYLAGSDLTATRRVPFGAYLCGTAVLVWYANALY